MSERFEYTVSMKRMRHWFLLSTTACFCFSNLQEIEYITDLSRPNGSLRCWGFMCEMRPAKLPAQTFKSS